jgi:pimeloyl-ACP methyl ester carboxylesterase
VRVENRHVIYVQGYDPRGLAQYYRMFRTELRKFDALYGVTSSIGRPRHVSEDEIASWSIETRAADWQTRTTYDFLRVEDLIQRDMAMPSWRIVTYTILIYLRLIVHGTVFRFMAANWRFLIFITWPHIVFWFEVACLALIAPLVRRALDALGTPAPFDWLVTTALFIAALWALLKTTEKYTYLLYLMCDTIWTWEFSHSERPEWDARLDRFAEHLCEVARNSNAEEIVLVGHSSGSFLGTEILGRALERDPELGRHGPRIALLTLGGNTPIVGYHKAAKFFRDHLRLIATEPSVDWIDCQARKDVMNFFDFDPLASHGIDVGPARRNPTIVPIRFRDMILPQNYNRFRWQFFRVHFQFVMANEVRHPYDFFMIACGPVPLRERMARPDAALAIASDDEAMRAQGWRELEAPLASAADAPKLGTLERSTPQHG